MNAIHFLLPTNPNACKDAKPAANPNLQPAMVRTRHLHRERDFGVGYGNSSGYASQRRYTSNWAPSHFKFG